MAGQENTIRKSSGGAVTEVPPGAAVKLRIHFLDELRGLAVLLMFIYHGFYTLTDVFHHPLGRVLTDIFDVAQPFFAGLFILLCGLSCHLSHNNLRRGLILVGASVGISLFLRFFTPENMWIWFGILHFLATAILIYCLTEKLLKRIPTWVGLILCAVGLLLTIHINPFPNGQSVFGIPHLLEIAIPESWVNTPWLLPLGIGYAWSADYFPLLPWIFVFLAGTFIGRGATAGWFPKWMYRKHVPFFSWLGRNALWAYLLHQPILVVVLWLVFFIVGLF